jgi:hypothetical protein
MNFWSVKYVLGIFFQWGDYEWFISFPWDEFSMGDYEWFISFPWDELSILYGAYQLCMLGYTIWLLDWLLYVVLLDVNTSYSGLVVTNVKFFENLVKLLSILSIWVTIL